MSVLPVCTTAYRDRVPRWNLNRPTTEDQKFSDFLSTLRQLDESALTPQF